MKKFVLCIVCLFSLSSCAYYSETVGEVSANKIKSLIPVGAVPIPAEGEKPKVWFTRKMYFSLFSEFPNFEN